MLKLKLGGTFLIKCFGKDGKLKWEDTAKNLVTNEGLNHALDVLFHGTSAIGTWYIGLKNAGTPVVGDTLASHASWTENTNYADDRKEYEEAAAVGQSITNSANKAEFTIDTDTQTITGAFLCSVATTTTGILFSVADFDGGSKEMDTDDALEVIYQIDAEDG